MAWSWKSDLKPWVSRVKLDLNWTNFNWTLTFFKPIVLTSICINTMRCKMLWLYLLPLSDYRLRIPEIPHNASPLVSDQLHLIRVIAGLFFSHLWDDTKTKINEGRREKWYERERKVWFMWEEINSANWRNLRKSRKITVHHR